MFQVFEDLGITWRDSCNVSLLRYIETRQTFTLTMDGVSCRPEDNYYIPFLLCYYCPRCCIVTWPVDGTMLPQHGVSSCHTALSRNLRRDFTTLYYANTPELFRAESRNCKQRQTSLDYTSRGPQIMSIFVFSKCKISLSLPRFVDLLVRHLSGKIEFRVFTKHSRYDLWLLERLSISTFELS